MAPELQPMRDVIVVLPGIMGSVLQIDGQEVWGLSRQAFIANLLCLSRNLRRLELAPDIGDGEPKDGVTATRLMLDLHILPGLWKIDGYGSLLRFLRARFELIGPTPDEPGNLILFPYDWRLSCVVSARRLSELVLPELERWQRHTANSDAKLVLICHSMGGLVARWFLEVLGGRDLTRLLVTIGTPFQGSVNALDALANGVTKGLAPFHIDLTKLVRSFPSVYQLLPTYDCIDLGDGTLRRLADATVPHLDPTRVAGADDFHRKIAERVASSAGRYQIIPVKGGLQPTAQSAVVRGDRVEPLRVHRGVDYGGDGTVPRPSAHPPEWGDDSQAVFAAQRHAALQNSEGILHQLFGVLTTGRLARWMGGAGIGVEIPDVVGAGEAIPVVAIEEGDDSGLPLRVTVQREDGTEVGQPQLLYHEGHRRYSARLQGLPAGAYRIIVESAVPERPVDAVSDLLLVWDPAAV